MPGFRGVVLVLVGFCGCAGAVSYTPGRSFANASPEDERRVKRLVARAWRRGIADHQKDEIADLKKYGYVVVPKLLRSLRSMRSARRGMAAGLLSIIDDPVTIPYILKNIPDRCSPREALVAMSDESTAAFYLDALREPCSATCENGYRWDRCVPGYAIYMLGRLRSVEAVPGIIVLLRGPHSDVAAKAILNIGEAALPALLADFKRNPRGWRLARLLGELRAESAVEALISSATEGERLYAPAVMALGRIGDGAAVQALAGLARKRWRAVHYGYDDMVCQCGPAYVSDSRAVVCKALGYARDPSAIGVLERLLVEHKRNPAVRKACIDGLGRLRAGDVLARLLKDGDKRAAMEAAIVLADMGDSRCVQVLAAALRDEELCHKAVSASAKLPVKELVPHLIDALRRARAETPAKKKPVAISAAWVIEALREITNRAYAPLTRSGHVDRGMTEEDRLESLRAYEAWWKENADRTREEWLLADIKNSDKNIGYSAIQRLGKSRYRGAVSALLRLQRAEDVRVRIYAIEALGRIGDPSALPAIKTVPEPEFKTMCLSWHRYTSRQARLALGDKSAVPELIRELRNAPGHERREAADLLRAGTGVSFGFRWDDPKKVRELRVEKWEKWWQEKGDDFVLKPVRWE